MQHPQHLTAEEFSRCRNQIAALPDLLEATLEALTPAQLALPYREGGWNGYQVVHHLADSHMNGFSRFKLALTEDNPSVFGYDQDKWALLPDSTSTQIEESISILKGVHLRWGHVLDHVTEADRARTYFHMGYQQSRTLDFTLSLYAWHGLNHIGHLRLLEKHPA